MIKYCRVAELIFTLVGMFIKHLHEEPINPALVHEKNHVSSTLGSI